MKTLKLICAAALLSVMLVVTAQAGDIHSPGIAPPPPPEDSTAPGDISSPAITSTAPGDILSPAFVLDVLLGAIALV
jgi:hypothetical protein